MAERRSSDGTVGKALAVLDQIAAFGRPVRFSELLEGSQFPKASLHRFLQTLRAQDMVWYDDERQTYSPGPRLLRLAHSTWGRFSLGPLAAPQLDSLARDVRETVHLAQLDHAQVLFVDKRNAVDAAGIASSAGKIGPAYCTGVGKVMLAWLDAASLDEAIPQQSFHRFTRQTITDPGCLKAELAEIRDRGYAFDREEHEPGVICVALPVLSAGRRPLGAVSVTSTTSRRSIDSLEALVPRIRAATDAISGEARFWQFPERPHPADKREASRCPE